MDSVSQVGIWALVSLAPWVGYLLYALARKEVEYGKTDLRWALSIILIASAAWVWYHGRQEVVLVALAGSIAIFARHFFFLFKKSDENRKLRFESSWFAIAFVSMALGFAGLVLRDWNLVGVVIITGILIGSICEKRKVLAWLCAGYLVLGALLILAGSLSQTIKLSIIALFIVFCWYLMGALIAKQ